MMPAEGFEARTYRKVDVRIVPFLFLCYVLAYLDRVNVGFAKLQMLKDLSLSDAAFATGAGIFFIGYFFFEVLSNVLLKKFGARTWIARIMISWGIISACMIFVKGAWSLCHAFSARLGRSRFLPGSDFLSDLVVSLKTAIHPNCLVRSGNRCVGRCRQSDLRLDHGCTFRHHEVSGMAVAFSCGRHPFNSGWHLGDLSSRQQR
jgi:hypothetical protein